MNCLIATAGNGSEVRLYHSPARIAASSRSRAQRSGNSISFPGPLSSRLFHARTVLRLARPVFRLARRRPQLALSLTITAGAALSAAAASAGIVLHEAAALRRSDTGNVGDFDPAAGCRRPEAYRTFPSDEALSVCAPA